MSANRNVRKFIDLVRRVSGKWTNWDPPIPVKVGAYGTLNEDGQLIVEGNIYDDDFQRYLDANQIDLNLKAYQPELCEPEQDFIVASTGVKKRQFDVNQQANVPWVASATIKGTWQFQDGKRGALVILYAPRQNYVPTAALQKILEAKRLEGKHIVTSALACPAYLMYLSDKGGENFSVAFSARNAGPGVVSSGASAGWWTNNEAALLRRASHPKGEPRFTPLFTLQKKVKPSWLRWRGEDETDGPEEYIWQDVYPSWKPLNEDGEELED